MIPTALLGYGLSGRYLQSPFLAAHPGFELCTVMTSRAADLSADHPNAVRVDTPEAVLADPAIELVCIATPNATHYDLARAALEAGKHVLVDKPACPTAVQLRELRDLATRKKRHLFVFHNRRWDGDFLTVKKVLDRGKIGSLVAYEARYDRYKVQPNAKAWKETPGPASGLIYDLGVHLLDQVIALFGPPRHAGGHVRTQRPGSTVTDAFRMHLEYADFDTYLSGSLLVREPTARYRLHGTQGAFVKYGIDVQEDQLRAGMAPGNERFGREPGEQTGHLTTQTGRAAVATETGHWYGLFNNIYQVITQGQAPAVAIEDVILQLEIMESIS